MPEIADIQVLEGFDSDGQAMLRAPKTDITLDHLMLHTSGLSYEFFSEDDLKYRELKEIPTIISSTFDSIKSVLLYDPGERRGYDVSLDWVGKIVEAVRDKRLDEVMKERIFNPLDINESSFTLTPSMQSCLATIHQRAPDGQLTAIELVLPQPPEMDMGGHGLYSTIGDYMKFIRMILNDGAGSNARVLKPETVKQMSKNGLGELRCGAWVSSIPSLVNDGEIFPGPQKSWAYTFMVNEEEAPNGPTRQPDYVGRRY